MIHPQSYVHSIIRYRNGLIKMILHNTDMKIPLSNTLYGNYKNINNVKKISASDLNKLSFYEVDKKRFPSIKLINKCMKGGLLAPTIMNASNEELVSLFLKKKVKFVDIVNTLEKIFKEKDFKKYAKRKVKSMKDIYKSDKWSRLKTHAMSVK